MKTPSFWYPNPTCESFFTALLPSLLSPLSYAFEAGTRVRRAFAKPYQARIPVICIGNVVAGGAGKTPTALALAHMLKTKGEKPVFVTRGYGGDGKTVYVDPARSTAEEVGDESLLLASVAPTWAGPDRIEAMRQAAAHGTFVLMDDGLQNPTLAPTASILVIDGEVGIGNGRIIPAGPLRESLTDALAKVVAVIIIGQDRQNLAKHPAIAGKKTVFSAQLQPNPAPGFPHNSKFVAFAGIGRPEKFYATARAMGLDIAETVDFPDHHLFEQIDIDMLRLRAEEKGARLLTTQKDAVRLTSDFRSEVIVLPVKLVFDDPDAATAIARLCFDLC